jgi:hypothetical protein
MTEISLPSTLIPSVSMLTPQDLTLIESMIDQRIRAAIPPSKSVQSSQAKGYHTSEAIRDLIRQHATEFFEWVGDQPFSLEVLRCFLKRKTTLLPGDNEILKGDKNCIRFDRQVANAVEAWRDCPFQKSETRKFHYEVKR